MASEAEKPPVQDHVEDERDDSGASKEFDSRIPEVAAEPVVTFKTWIVISIQSLGYGLSFVPVPVMAAVGANIATDVGDPTSNLWYISAWIVSITIGWMIVGANTDLFGRRWFLVMGSLICAVGHICIGCAKNAATIIAGMAIVGFGAALCQMATFTLTELLPNKWRHIGMCSRHCGTGLC